jgi:hypothetical protein
MTRWTVMTLTLLCGTTAAVHATTFTSTFEDQGLAASSFSNNAGPSGRFVSGGNSFNNNFDTTFGSWSGWAVSSTTDATTHGFGNQYSAITGGGAGGSATYGVAFTSAFPTANPNHPADSFVDLAAGSHPVSIQVTNTTYAYWSMKEGDQFSKAFGAGDYFLLDIKGYSGLGGVGSVVGEVDFYLANFLGRNSYIINTWQTVDLGSLLGAKSLRFGLQSTDNDPTFGMNTPAYFAADNLQVSSAPEPGSLVLALIGSLGLMIMWRRRRTGRTG